MTHPLRLELADMVRDLTERHTHRQEYNREYAGRRGTTIVLHGQNHITHVPSLIDQLQHATPSGQVEERDDTGYASRPAARLDALDTLRDIDTEASRWVRLLGHNDPGDRIDPKTGRAITGSGTLACIRLLHSLTPQLPDATRHAITRDVRRWWTWARIATGWDSPPWRPDNTCPMCGERRTLRINLVAELAVCSNDACRETWDNTTIGLLADHIRLESEEHRAPLLEPAPCMCRLPMERQGRWGMCPACGSSVCVNAEAVAAREADKRAAAAEAAKLEQLERIAAAATRQRLAQRRDVS